MDKKTFGNAMKALFSLKGIGLLLASKKVTSVMVFKQSDIMTFAPTVRLAISVSTFMLLSPPPPTSPIASAIAVANSSTLHRSVCLAGVPSPQSLKT